MSPIGSEATERRISTQKERPPGGRSFLRDLRDLLVGCRAWHLGIRVLSRDESSLVPIVALVLLASCGQPSTTPSGKASEAAEALEPAPAAEPEATGAPSLPTALVGTHWQLLEFQSMDDAIGTMRPEDPSLYTLTFEAEGSLSMRLNCNNAMGSWVAEPAEDGQSGQLTIGPLAMTQAICPPRRG